MTYILFTGEDQNRKLFAVVQGSKDVDWSSLYRRFAQDEGMPYETDPGSGTRLSPGGTSRGFFDTEDNARKFLDWLVGKQDFQKLPFQEHTL